MNESELLLDDAYQSIAVFTSDFILSYLRQVPVQAFGKTQEDFIVQVFEQIMCEIESDISDDENREYILEQCERYFGE